MGNDGSDQGYVKVRFAAPKMTMEEVIEHFANRADEYIEWSRGPAEGPLKVEHLAKQNPERLVDAGWWLKAYAPTANTVIDLGCGAGRLAKFWRGLNFCYLGVDPSEKVIEQAKKWYPPDIGIEFAKAPITMIVPNPLLDVAFTFGVLQHVPYSDIAEIVKTMVQLTKLQMIVEMVRCDAKTDGPHIFIHDYPALFGPPVYEEWLDDFKKILIFKREGA